LIKIKLKKIESKLVLLYVYCQLISNLKSYNNIVKFVIYILL